MGVYSLPQWVGPMLSHFRFPGVFFFAGSAQPDRLDCLSGRLGARQCRRVPAVRGSASADTEPAPNPANGPPPTTSSISPAKCEPLAEGGGRPSKDRRARCLPPLLGGFSRRQNVITFKVCAGVSSSTTPALHLRRLWPFPAMEVLNPLPEFRFGRIVFKTDAVDTPGRKHVRSSASLLRAHAAAAHRECLPIAHHRAPKASLRRHRTPPRIRICRLVGTVPFRPRRR